MNEVLRQIVAGYLEAYPDETPELELLQSQLAADETMNDRNNFRGHVTGSGIVLSPDLKKVLLIHHKFFDRWQQSGGHWESDDEATPLEAARREVYEETGITIARYIPLDADNPLVPLDIDTHAVGARPERSEPDHHHHDFRYCFVAISEELTHQEEEVNAARWFDRDAPETKHVRRPLAKLTKLL